MASYSRQVLDNMYPPENRVLAGVAATRTFKQTIKSGVAVLVGGGVGGAVALTQETLVGFVPAALGLTLVVLLFNALGAAFVAWDDVAQNGLNAKYADAVEEQQRGKYGDYPVEETA